MAKKSTLPPTPEQQERYRQLVALRDIRDWLYRQRDECLQNRDSATDPVTYWQPVGQLKAINSMQHIMPERPPDDPAAWLASELIAVQAQAEYTLVLIARMRDMMAGAGE